MSDSKQQSSRAVESSSSGERTNRTEYVERSDVGVSLTVKLKRGTGTRDQEAGYVAYDDGLQLLDQTLRDVGIEFLTAAAATSPPSISEAYVLPQFAGMNYAFTAIDAVYVWTHGGYQVARDPEDYPLFIAVHESDLDAWTLFFDRFGVPTAEERQPADDLDGAIQVVLEPRPQIVAEMVDGPNLAAIEVSTILPVEGAS